MITGELAGGAFATSIPYGLGVMSILTGKHIDQMAFDSTRGIHTLPVVIGERAARGLTIGAIAAMYLIVAALIAGGSLTPFAAVVVVGLPRASRAIRVLSQPRPAAAPKGYVGWPLWHHRACLVHNRLFGWAYIFGLGAGAVFRALS
jgi:1,4-dihydroxy-2-naphthoate octaprenyltransferase